MQQTFILVGVEWGVDDPSWAAVNKITAHTGSYIPLIHHLLPAASCHTLSVLATENLQSERGFGEIKGKKKKTVMGFWLANALQWRRFLTMCDSCKCAPISSPRQRADGSNWPGGPVLPWLPFKCHHRGADTGGKWRTDGGSCCSLGVTYRRG